MGCVQGGGLGRLRGTLEKTGRWGGEEQSWPEKAEGLSTRHQSDIGPYWRELLNSLSTLIQSIHTKSALCPLFTGLMA